VKDHSDTHRRIGVFASFIRYVFKTVLGWLSFLTITANKERRAIHDLISGSVVINIRQYQEQEKSSGGPELLL
jgi:uncharacterized RDD family membrane protein YckC